MRLLELERGRIRYLPELGALFQKCVPFTWKSWILIQKTPIYVSSASSQKFTNVFLDLCRNTWLLMYLKKNEMRREKDARYLLNKRERMQVEPNKCLIEQEVKPE